MADTTTIIGDPDAWRAEWWGMPEFKPSKPPRKIPVSFEAPHAVDAFARLIKQRITPEAVARWFPRQDWDEVRKFLCFVSDGTPWGDAKPRYPIYVPSKGRWDFRPTITTLERMNTPFRVVVEPSEYALYAEYVDAAKLLLLPDDFSKYGNGLVRSRQWIFQHAIDEGHAKHWQIDDNIYGILRLVDNARLHVYSSAPFRVVEDFCDRYDNIAISGFQYDMFSSNADLPRPPYRLNARVYSMSFFNHAMPYRHRGRYNDDTDICLQALKGGWCTVLFNMFIGDKAATMTRRGGNTPIYTTGDKRLEFAQELRDRHPDVVRVVRRYERWHHEVDYDGFADNRLIRRVPRQDQGVNEYGMKLVARDGKRPVLDE